MPRVLPLLHCWSGRSAIAPDPALASLAALHGVHRSYVGADGGRHRVDPDVVRAVLGAMGVPARTPTDAAHSLAEGRRTAARVPLDAVLTERVGAARPFAVTLPAAVDPHDAWVSVEPEEGGVWRQRLSVLSTRRGVEREVDGRRLAVHGITRRPGLRLAPGYHRVVVEAPQLEGDALMIVAPPCHVPERSWGVFLPLHAVRTEADWGIGSYPDLGDLAQWVRRSGGSLLGTLPLYPLLSPPLAEDPVDPSPYLPASRLAYSELYVDPAVQPELDLAPDARRVLDGSEFTRRLLAARKAPLVNYEAVARLRRQVLEPMAHALFAVPSGRREQLESFFTEHPELSAYARFRAARESGRQWSSADAAVPSGAEAAALEYHLYTQWAAAEQLAAASASGNLYVDLPIGVHPEGFDPRWEPGSFVGGAQGGAPPDDFQPGGQIGGSPRCTPSTSGPATIASSSPRCGGHCPMRPASGLIT